MDLKSFYKLVAKFIIIFSLIGLVGGGIVYAGYKTLQGDSNFFKQIGRLIGLNKNPGRVNALLLGTDEGGNRTDFIMFMSYNPANNKLNMISIPRDTRVYDSNDKKINSVYTKGKEEAMVKEVENILNLPIDYYAVVNFSGFRKIVDQIGGIPVNVPMDMIYSDPYQNLNIDIRKGYQVLNGEKAEGFVRYRKGYATADLGRIEAQHEFINSAIAQFIKPQNITKLPSIISIILDNVKTNATAKDILSYIGDASKITSDDIISERLPGEPKYISGGSYYVYDKEKTKKMVETMFMNEEDVNDKEAIERNKNYKVEVFNGTNIPGLGTKVTQMLQQKGFNVIRTDNYGSLAGTTKIFERNRKVEGSYVKTVIKVGEVSADYDESSDVDLTVIVGEDINN